MMGGGETYMEKARKQLNESESKIKKALTNIKQQRKQMKAERIRRSIPQVALVGYTNTGTCPNILLLFGLKFICQSTG